MASESSAPAHPMGKLLPIHTPRLIIRAATDDDMPNCLARALDPECTKYLPHLNHQNHTVETCRKWKNFMEKIRHEGGGLWVLAERKEDGLVIGDGGVEQVYKEDAEGKRLERTAEGAGLTLIGEGGLMLASGADVRGRGFADEALTAFIHMAFRGGEDERGMGVDEVRFDTLSSNPGFAKLGRRLKMKESQRINEKGTSETRFQLTRTEYEEGLKHGLWDVNAFACS